MKRALLKLTARAPIFTKGLTATSCRKETVYIKDRVVVLPAVHTVDGTWVVSYTVDVLLQLRKQYYSLILKPDGTAINETKWTGQTYINPAPVPAGKMLCLRKCRINMIRVFAHL